MSAQNGIDKIILSNIPEPGFFVEAGGSDPVDQNNTYLLEQNGWTGLIVEPKEDFNNKYSQIRPNSIVENFVLVDSEFEGDTISGDFSQYMMGGVVNTHSMTNWSPSEYPCTTLKSLLKKHEIDEVAFFSLDVEGYEEEVLNGTDFDEVFFHVLVVENHGSLNGVNKSYDFSFLLEKNFERKGVIRQHEFFVNKGSPYFDSFSL